MNNVVGPFTMHEWRHLGFYRDSIRHMKSVDPIAYRDAIEKETSTFKRMLKVA